MIEQQKKLNSILADTFLLYMKVYKFHWNIKGENFISIHKLYNDLYEYLYDSVDTIAERMTGLGYYAPCSCAEFIKLGKVVEKEGFDLTIEETITELSNDLEILIKDLTDSYSILDEATVSLLTGFELEIAKYKWLISSN